jgi:glutathione S-transferase
MTHAVLYLRPQVPVLVDTNAAPEPAAAHGLSDEPGALHCAEGLVVRESAAILTYLVHVYGRSTAWLPGADEPVRAARCAAWLSYAGAEVNSSLLKVRVSVLFGWDIAPLSLDAALALSRGVLAHLDAQLAAGAAAGRTWLVEGEAPTIADVSVFPYVAYAEDSSKGALQLSAYPALCAWLAAFKALPGYMAPPGLE